MSTKAIISPHKKVSVIHGLKCCCLADSQKAHESTSTAIQLHDKIDGNEDIKEDLIQWMNHDPIVTDKEVEDCFKKKYSKK